MITALRGAVVALLLLQLPTARLCAQQLGNTPLDIRVPSAPRVLLSLGRQHLVYEVHLTNFGGQTASVAELAVLSNAAVIENYAGPRLNQRLVLLGQRGERGTTSMPLPPGAHAVAFLWVSIPPGATTPTSLQHRVVLMRDGALKDTVTAAAVRVHTDVATAAALAAPVRGGPWVAIRGPSNTTGHRLSFVALGGTVTIPQRFAVDWAMLGADGRLFHDDSTVAGNWYGFAQPVLAVASGVVVLRRDGVPDRAPFSVTATPVLTPAEATGNVLVLKLDDGRYATYAHLRAGSVRFEEGTRVTQGEPIAAVGNSGNTLGPHLHFHLSDAPGLLQGEGLPFTMRSVELLGRVSSSAELIAGRPWLPNPAQPPRMLSHESPLENMIVRWR